MGPQRRSSLSGMIASSTRVQNNAWLRYVCKTFLSKTTNIPQQYDLTSLLCLEVSCAKASTQSGTRGAQTRRAPQGSSVVENVNERRLRSHAQRSAGHSYFGLGASRRTFRALRNRLTHGGGLGNLLYTVGSPIFASNNGRLRATKIEKVTRKSPIFALFSIWPCSEWLYVAYKATSLFFLLGTTPSSGLTLAKR